MASKALALAAVGACVFSVGLATPAMAAAAAAADDASYQATLNPITANKVTGNGEAWVTLNGDSATIKMTVNGLLDGAPHAQHIHIDGKGRCPTDAEATDHNGNLAISTPDGAPLYGTIGTSLTLTGDTSPAAALAIEDFPATGNFTYERTIDLDPAVVSNLENGTAVIVVHGIDYNGNGKYDDVLGPSPLDKSLPLEATAPALCGPLAPMQTSAVPQGGVATGGGSTAANGVNTSAVAVGALALFAAAGSAVLAYRRRRPAQD